MSKDIVERLRAAKPNRFSVPLLCEAADEIERLREEAKQNFLREQDIIDAARENERLCAALERIAAGHLGDEAIRVARAALDAEEDCRCGFAHSDKGE